MIFTDIRLQNYRSYDDASFELGPGVNIVVGANAAGKTNLLEGIMVAATGRSYRAKDPILIKTEQQWARIDVHTNLNQTRIVKIQTDPNGCIVKSFDIDDKHYKRLSQSFKYPIVLFEPNNLSLLHSEPANRRDYIDDLIEQYVDGYATLRSSYRRVVSQRNALLKQGSRGTSQLFAWNLRLCELGSQIAQHRIDLITTLNQKIADTYMSIAQKEVLPKFVYESKTNIENYSTSLMTQLEAGVQIDLERGFTSRGPHRDDIVVYFGDVPAASCASRGEIRTLILSLKILELQILEDKTERRPLLLLDDVFSELDGARRRALTDYLKDYQVIITTTDADVVMKEFKSAPNIIAL